MMQTVRSMFKIQELRQRLLFTLFVLFLCRVGAFIPLPGIDAKLLAAAAAKNFASIPGRGINAPTRQRNKTKKVKSRR
ncbi:MAG: hypothetical protein R6V48_00245, partial [Fidelibacterota bacterium]